MAKIIDGKSIADAMLADIKEELSVANDPSGSRLGRIVATRPPGLGVVLVGDRKDSQTYVRLKLKSAEQCGMQTFNLTLPADISQESLEKQISNLSANDNVDGIILQLPLPSHLSALKAVLCIDPMKDVDGLHPLNVGYLNTIPMQPLFSPATPCGVMTMLAQCDIPTAGKDAIVIGRSMEVGLPLTQMMQQGNATVTLAHRHTRNLEEKVRKADIVICACRCPEMIRGSWIKPQAVAVDIGINAVSDSTKKSGFRLVGDLCFSEVKEVAGYVTPVPGGVGPMTVASALHNVWRGFQRRTMTDTAVFDGHKMLPSQLNSGPNWTTYNHHMTGNFKKLVTHGVRLFR